MLHQVRICARIGNRYIEEVKEVDDEGLEKIRQMVYDIEAGAGYFATYEILDSYEEAVRDA